jgi:NADH-quinone oxidoreductase subunit J
MNATYIMVMILSFLTVSGALFVVWSKNPIHSVISLILTFFSLSAHYVVLNAQFLAIVNLIVYAGAIMVLFLFVLMLLNLNKESEPVKPMFAEVSAAIAAGLLLVVLVAALRDADQRIFRNPVEDAGMVKNLGKLLFTKYLVPFELSGILFLAAMVGAVLLGKRSKSEEDEMIMQEGGEK